MSPEWKRIAGVEIDPAGLVAAVWLGHDKLSDVVTLYDCCKFNAEVLAIIAEGMNARGRWIPIAWSSTGKDFADKLLDRGCNILYDPIKETPQMAEIASRDIQERMRTGRFKVDKRMAEWLQEFELFSTESGKIPITGYPLMSATRYAIGQLNQSKRLPQPARHKVQQRRIAMI